MFIVHMINTRFILSSCRCLVTSFLSKWLSATFYEKLSFLQTYVHKPKDVHFCLGIDDSALLSPLLSLLVGAPGVEGSCCSYRVCKYMVFKLAVSFVGATAEADWVPLELCFGIPLFSSELNRKVCQKIATHGLCRKER